MDRLTALRGVACVVVLARHWIETFHTRTGVHVFVDAASVVSFFFILSGFVLTWGHRPGDTTGAYLRRRFARIYPLYLLGLAAGAVINHAQLSAATSVPALFLVQSFIPSPRYYYAVTGVGWSLSCEAFMYAAFPLLIERVLRLSPRARRRLLVGLVVVAWALPLVVRSHQQDSGLGYWVLYIFPGTRMIEFVIGMLLAVEVKAGYRPRIKSGSALALVIACIVAGSWLPVYVGWVALTLIPFMLLVTSAAVADLDGRPSRLHARRLVLFGEISYAFYLLHRPLLAVLHKGVPAPDPVLEAVLAAVALAGTLVAAHLVHRHFEVPLERRLRPRARRAEPRPEPALAPAPAVAQPRAVPRRVPNFLIVGAAKSGSTALAKILNQHPDVFVPDRKESHHLLWDAGIPAFCGPGDDHFLRGVIADPEEYQRLFDGVTTQRAVGEASVYYQYRTDALPSIAGRLPGTKVITILREPVGRAFSAYSHLRRDGRETPDTTFADALALEDDRAAAGWEYIWRLRGMGLYAPQVQALYDAFGRDNTLVLLHEDLEADPHAVIRRAFAFLDVDPSFTPDVGIRPNASGVPRSAWVHSLATQPHPVKEWLRPRVPEAMFAGIQKRVFRFNLRQPDRPTAAMATLAHSYRDDQAELAALTGLDLSRWQDPYR